MTKTALVVDDSMTIRKLVARSLQSVGFQVFEAGNGREGIAALAKQTVSVIITDFNMPVMDGLEFVQAVRSDARHRFTPIVFLTTEADESRRDQARSAGATAWILKPFAPDKVLTVVNKVVPA